MESIRKKLAVFADKVFGNNLALEHIIFIFGAFAGIVLSAFGTISNLMMDLHIISVFIPLINLIVDIACIIYSIKTKKWRGAAFFVFLFASFVLFPFLWFTTGGTMSSSLPLIIGLGVVLAIIFKGKTRVLFFFATLVLYSAFIMFELYIPNNFIPYPNREAWYTDVLCGFVMSYLASGGLAFFTISRYNSARKKSEALVKQLETISVTDPLTGVFNRRHLMLRIDDEMRKAYDNGNPLTLCIIDIDHFKRVNDTFGHIYGDEVLTVTASTIASCLSENEFLGRYGGEEFIVVFSGSDLHRSLRTIDRIFEALGDVKWKQGDAITVSVGMSVYTKGVSYSNFLGSADENLYKAKDSGRNRVEYK